MYVLHIIFLLVWPLTNFIYTFIIKIVFDLYKKKAMQY